MTKTRLALIGAGSRSRAYTDELLGNLRDAELVCVVEPDEKRRQRIVDLFHIELSLAFDNEDDFFRSKLPQVDAVIICTMDQDHHRQAIRAIDCGYCILLEKPVALTPEDCQDIALQAKAKGVRVMVCHVLRYAPFFLELKKIILSNRLGRVISVQHNENINIFHFSHSYVRGSWRRTDTAAPIILAKSSHDFDILAWLIDSRCRSVTSFGSLTYFKESSAPEDSAERCYDCKVEGCIFNAEYVYIDGQWWNKGAVSLTDPTDEGVRRELKTGQYGRCVYRCDNDVCDHQVAAMEFENGVTATFNLSAFTNPCSRTIKIMCEKGELRGDMNTIEILPFAGQVETLDMKDFTDNPEGHGGGDVILLEDFLSLVRGGEGVARTSIEQSVESHMMAFAAERSRLENRVVQMTELRP